MNVYKPTSVWEASALDAELAGPRRRRAPGAAKHMLFAVFATVSAIAISTQCVLAGISMSEQELDVAFNGALASLLAIVCSFVVTRRLLSFPLLRTYGYIALTFVSSFAMVAIGLKFFRINFSTPQFFLAMILIIGLVELFVYASRQWMPTHIAVVPGTTSLAELPELLAGSIRFTLLSSVPGPDFAYNGVIADLSSELEPKWERFLALSALRSIPVYHVKQFNEAITGRVAVDHLRENTLGAVVPSLIYPQLKRAFDIMGAALCLPLVTLMVVICAILIKLESPGPIFYRQPRAGFGGRPFIILKLRTMRHDHAGADFTVAGDERITRVGRSLRRYRLDELPQIINILRGDMSWIGPRPEALSLARWYEREVPFYIYRHIVQPGITGWAQVNQGNVAAIEAAREKLQYDFYYIKHFSVWLDAVIVLKTLRTIMTGFGSR